MLDQDTEILISRYADGGDELTADELRQVRNLVAGDAEARSLLEDYLALTAALREAAPLVPKLDWDRLHGHLSAAMDEAGEADNRRRMRIGRPMTTPMRWALAASVLLCVGLALLATQPAKITGVAEQSGGVARMPDARPSMVATIDVSGPSIDPPDGTVQLDVSIGQPAITAESAAAIAQDVVWRTPQINIVAVETSATEPTVPRQ